MLSTDPLFVAPIAASSAPTTTGDYRLQTGSPAIDAGNNLSVTVATDLDGNPRIVNGVVDMGAYEYQPPPSLSLTKQVTPTTDVVYQGVVTYTLVLSNSGGAADGAAILTDTLPAGTTFARWIEQNGAAIDAGQLTWGSGAVDAGAAITVSFAVTNTAGGGATITNTAWFSGSLQTGSAAAAYTTSTTLTPSGSGNWNQVFPPCTGVCQYVVPAGVAITLTADIALNGDFEVEPGGTFVPNGKTVTLTGDRAQTLTGNPLIFYNLVVDKTNKTDTVTIDGKLKVTKKLTVRKGSLVSASTYEDLEIEANGVLTLTSPITITGHFTNAGELNTEGNTVRFAGGKEQNLVLEVMTWFDDLEVYTGTTLIETVTDDNALVQGTLTNYGVIRKTQPIASPLDPDPANNVYYFGLAGAYSYGLEIAITALDGVDPLTAIQVDRIDQPQPNGPASGGEPIYWTITGTGSDFVADVTLPHAGIATPLACRYSASVWTCARDEYDTDYVTFGGAMAFSDWAVYSCAPMVTVQNTSDSGAGSLRQAIADVCTGGAIDFAAGLNGQTITLSSELTVTRGMTIRSTAPITVSGANTVRVFNVSGGPVTLDGLTIRDGNAGAENGGGIYNSGVLTLTHSSVLSSTASFGGGMYNDHTSPTLTVVTFASNQAYNGGAISNDGSGRDYTSSPSLIDVIFSGNLAAGSGGAMYNNGSNRGASSPSLVNVTFSGNLAIQGGAIHNNGEGGVSSPSLVNVIFSGNQASDCGGAMYNYGFFGTSSPSLVNVTFSGNQAAIYGGAIFNNGDLGASSPSLVNVIVWGNTATTHGKQIYNDVATPSISHSVIPSTTLDIYDHYSTITWGEGNITSADADPLFVAPITATAAPTTTGDYRLRACSPAIDAGDSLSVTVATDLDGNSRIVNGVVDMGAYEAALMPCLAAAKQVTPTTNVPYQDVVTYTFTLSNSGNLTDTATLTDALPAEVAFGGWVESQGAEQVGNVITWSGPITPAAALTYVFTATHSAGVGVITNTATFSGSLQAGSADAAFTALCSPAITVQNAADSGAGSLHQAIADVCPGGVVDFNLSYPATITLTSAQLTVGKDMTIAGPGAANLAVSGANARRVFSITTGVNVTIDGLTIRDGNAGSGNGGGIYNSGVLTLTHSSVLSSTARDGGGMYNDRTSPMVGSVIFSGNLAGNDGGGVYNNGYAGASSPSLVNVTFSGNQAARDGGAMLNNGNEHGASSPSLVNVTFSGNQAARYGGAMINAGAYGGTSGPNLVNVIMWGNTATIGSQIHNISASPVISFSTIEGGCPAGATCNSEMSYVDPLFVAPIAAGRAPTTTGDYRLRACSPAIDAGDNLSVTVATDLDGNSRIVNGVVDMGAYEAALMPCLHLAKAVTPTTNVPYQGVVTYTLTLSNSGVLTDTAALTDALPAEVAFGGWVANPGAEQAANVITWSGPITPATALTYIFTATHTAAANSTVTNTAEFSGSLQSDQAAAAFTTVAAATTTAIASDPNPSSYGQSVVFTATVAAAGGPPTGDVVFEIDDTPVHTGTLTSGVATYATASLAVGDHPVYAEYVGSANFIASESAVITQTVLKATAAVTLTALSQTYDGTPKAATAATAPAGLTVNLTYDGSTTQPTAAGSYTVVGAVDDPSYTGVATDTLVIATAGTTTTLTSAPNPALAGASVTFTATVTVQPTGDGRSGGAGRWGGGGPTGNVTFQDGATNLGAVALTNGVATFSTSTLAVGSHTITAVYAGDSNHAGNTSALLVQVIDRGVTAVNDATGALEATPVTIAVRANDHDPAGLGLTVITVTQGVNGAVAIAAGGQTVIYTPTAAFTGTDSFAYGVQDGNGATDQAFVAVVVASEEETDHPTQVAVADPAISQTVAFSSTQTGVSVELPAGFYSGTVGGKDIFFLAFTPIVTPTHTAPPNGLKFGNVVFTLEAFLNDAPLGSITFATPVTLTLTYSPAQFSGIQLGTLALYAWDENAGVWSQDGITCYTPDTVNHTLTCVIAHLTEFGILGSASPTAATLADFGAAATVDAVTVLWTTADESNLAGFHLYRGAVADGPGVRLNGALIPAQGAGGLGGFSYSYVDAVATPPGAAWYYWLETVDFAGSATRHGPILAAALAPRLYLPAVMAGAGSAELAHTPGVTPVAQTAEEVQAEEISPPPPGDSSDETGGGAATVHLPLITR